MSSLELMVAVGDYDHVRDVTAGRIPIPGICLDALHLPVEQIFGRFAAHREWDVSEFSLAKYSSLVAAGDQSLVGIPVFPSRVFRHSSMYVRVDSGITSPDELAGRRVGIPEWAQTAAVYSRGITQHSYGVPLADVSWFQAGVNEPGRREKLDVSLPDGVSLTRVPDRSLSDMLLAGDLDAIFSARPPTCFTRGTGEVRRLFADYPSVERAYFRDTQIFPIMHVLVMRAEIHERHPWVARNLLEAFEAAKEASVARMSDVTASFVPLPWISERAADARAMFGDDPWPYGIEPNRKTLEAFLGFAHEQGVCARLLRPEDLFTTSVTTQVRV